MYYNKKIILPISRSYSELVNAIFVGPVPIESNELRPRSSTSSSAWRIPLRYIGLAYILPITLVWDDCRRKHTWQLK